MADETAKLVVAVDSTSAQAAAKDLDTMTEAARQAQRETRGFSAEQIAAMRAVAGGSTEYERLNQNLDALRDKERAAAMAARELTQAQNASVAASSNAETGIKKVSGAHANFSFTSGQAAREYAVLINEFQRGDFTRLQGSFITLANRVGVMPKLFTATGLAVGSVVAVLGTFALAAIAGAKEDHEFNRAMEATGGYAGKTRAEIVGLSEAMQDGAHTYAATKEALLAVAESGQFAQDRIALVARGVLDMSRVTGSSIEDTVKQFAKLQDDPVRGAMELDKSMHFLETSTLQAAIAAENLGDKEKASELVITAAAAAAHKRAEDMEKDVGYMIARWRELKGVVSDTWEWMKGLGKQNTDLENVVDTTAAIRTAQARLRDVQRGTLNPKTGLFTSADTEEVHKYTVALNLAVAAGEHAQQRLLDNTQLAQSNAELAHQNQLANEAVVSINARTMATDRLARRTAELAKVHKDYENARKSSDPTVRDNPTFSVEAEARAVADIERKYRDYKTTRVAMTQAEKDARKEENAHDQQLKTLDQTIAEHKAIVEGEKDSTKDLTETQKWGQRQIQMLSDAYSHLTPAEQAVRKAQIEAIVTQDDLNNSRQAEAQITEAATRALERYQKQGASRNVQNQRSLDAIGHSSEWASEQARQYQIIDEAENARIQLTDKARAAQQLETDAYKQGLQDIGDEMNRQLNLEQRFYADRKAAMGDWRNGAQRAWEEFSQKANDVAGQTYDSFQTAFSGMESAIDTFAKTGKFKFSDFARTVLAELAKIELRILLSKILTSMFGASVGGSSDLGGQTYGQSNTYEGGYGAYNGAVFSRGALTAFASGGTLIRQPTYIPMANGGTGLVGEQGEEGVFPLIRNSRGQLALHGSGGGGIGQVQSNVTVVLQNDGTSKVENTDANSKQAKMLGEFLTKRVKDLLVEEQRQGGILWRMNNG